MKITGEQLIDVITEASYRLHGEIKEAYNNGNLEGYLSSIGMIDLYPINDEPQSYETYPEGNIIIIGDSQIKDSEIFGCLKTLGIPKDRIELHTNYDEIKNSSFDNVRYNPKYRLVLFGATPHSSKGKGDESSIIIQMENTDGYPKVIRLTVGHKLKITKTSLKKAVSKEIQDGYLIV